MDIIFKDLTLDGLIYLKSLLVKHQDDLLFSLRSLDPNDSSRQELLDEINKLDCLIFNLF